MILQTEHTLPFASARSSGPVKISLFSLRNNAFFPVDGPHYTVVKQKKKPIDKPDPYVILFTTPWCIFDTCSTQIYVHPYTLTTTTTLRHPPWRNIHNANVNYSRSINVLPTRTSVVDLTYASSTSLRARLLEPSSVYTSMSSYMLQIHVPYSSITHLCDRIRAERKLPRLRIGKLKFPRPSFLLLLREYTFIPRMYYVISPLIKNYIKLINRLLDRDD